VGAVATRAAKEAAAWVGVPDLRTAGAAVQAVAAAVGGARGRVGGGGGGGGRGVGGGGGGGGAGGVGGEVLVETPEEGAVEISGRDLVSPSRPP
jgi:hypothetical protein